MAFVGEYSAKLDDKGRITFPAAFRAQLSTNTESKNNFVIKKDLFQQCLVLYTMDDWNMKTQDMLSKLNLFDPRQSAFWKAFNRDTAEVIVDEKTGRMNMSNKLLELVSIQKDVVLVGVGSEINIWDKDTYEQSALSAEDMANFAQEFLG